MPVTSPGYVELLRSNRTFGRLWGSNMILYIGDWFTVLAMFILAGEAVDKMDSEIQRRIQQRVQASKRSMVIGTLFAAFPLVVLLGLPKLL